MTLFQKFKLLSLILLFASLCACNTITRTETDIYTRVNRDTTFNSFVQNAPENKDRGVVFPSSRQTLSEHQMLTKDSVVERTYPDFIRYGLLETIGIFGGSSSYSIPVGPLGVFPDMSKLSLTYRGGGSSLFTGGYYKVGIFEKRLRWFRDAKDWVIGINSFEAIIPDAHIEKALISVSTPYVKKRWYLRDDIPYLCLSVTAGFGFYPSQYGNINGAVELGSLGGLNLRFYLGYATGYNSSNTPQISNNDYAKGTSTNPSIFYGGFGISFLDFVNRVPETEKEWKDYQHSSYEIGITQVGLLTTGSSKSLFRVKNKDSSFTNPTLKGINLKLINANIAIPYGDNRFYAGTSLLNIMVLGQDQFGMGILPLRVGYWATLLEDELTAEPFIEYNYYPSSFVNIGGKITLKWSNIINFGIMMGYCYGSTGLNFGKDALDAFGISNTISSYYLGISIGMPDRIFFPQELRYNK